MVVGIRKEVTITSMKFAIKQVVAGESRHSYHLSLAVNALVMRRLKADAFLTLTPNINICWVNFTRTLCIMVYHFIVIVGLIIDIAVSDAGPGELTEYVFR